MVMNPTVKKKRKEITFTKQNNRFFTKFLVVDLQHPNPKLNPYLGGLVKVQGFHPP